MRDSLAAELAEVKVALAATLVEAEVALAEDQDRASLLGSMLRLFGGRTAKSAEDSE